MSLGADCKVQGGGSYFVKLWDFLLLHFWKSGWYFFLETELPHGFKEELASVILS